MPIGIMVSGFAVVLGGIFGTVFGKKINDKVKENVTMIFGVSAMGMGITSIVLIHHLSAVVLSLIIGTIIGTLLKLGDRVQTVAENVQSALCKNSSLIVNSKENTAMLVTGIVLFCASGTGIYGSIISGISGDHSIMIAKSILDFFTAVIFSCSLGIIISLIAIPQVVIFLTLFFTAGLIFPLTTIEMINDFKAVGGFLMLATGFRMLKLKMFPTVEMIPALVVVMPISWLWTEHIMPLL